jgi:hypothetical protein
LQVKDLVLELVLAVLRLALVELMVELIMTLERLYYELLLEINISSVARALRGLQKKH